jgi:integrase
MANKITNWFEREGKIYARITYVDSEGKRRQKAKLVASKSDVPKAVRELQEEIAKGEPDVSSHKKTTLDEFLKTWLATVKQNVRYKTYTMYEYLIRCHVQPVLGAKELQKIRRLEVQMLITGMREKGLSAKTVRETYRVLKRVLQQAVDWDMRVDNPALKVEIPKKVHNEMKFLSDEQAQKFLREASKDRLGVLFHFALKTGMRPGEYLALRWSDVDLKNKRVTVQRALVESEDEDFGFAEPKTARGRRTIPLSESLVSLLEQHRKEQPDAHRFTHNLIFPSTKGTPISRRNLERRNFKTILRNAKLPDMRLYDLRHTHATLLLMAGENPKVVSERLGHANVAFTLETYTHVLPSMQEGATERLEKILKGK